MDGTRSTAEGREREQNVSQTYPHELHLFYVLMILRIYNSKHLPCIIVQGRYDIVCPVGPPASYTVSLIMAHTELS